MKETRLVKGIIKVLDGLTDMIEMNELTSDNAELWQKIINLSDEIKADVEA